MDLIDFHVNQQPINTRKHSLFPQYVIVHVFSVFGRIINTKPGLHRYNRPFCDLLYDNLYSYKMFIENEKLVKH